MKNSNIKKILPEKLLREIQKHVQGKSVYIPKLKEEYKNWGDNTQSKNITLKRNDEIRADFCNGSPIDELCEKYSLSPESIKKIVYCKI